MAAERIKEPCISGCQRFGASGGFCDRCRARRRAQNRKAYHERVGRGQCVYCRKASEIGIFCMTHWFKNVGVPHGLGNKKGIQLLSTVWKEQEGRCAVTGEILVPGNNASLDHLVPKAHGGTNERHNLQWVLLTVNHMKWDLDYADFIEMCRRVVREQDRKAALKAVENLNMRSN